MNTANLQLEGLYAAIAALMTALREKDLLTSAEIEAALAQAETRVASDPARPSELSHANLDAICFPLRFLRVANNRAAQGTDMSFSQIAAEIGRSKPDR
jgi:hypothetical protein